MAAKLQPNQRTMHMREQKVAQRKRTSELYHSLDPLVPTFTGRALEEKGSLPSGRTFLQLAEDTVAHVRNLRAQGRIQKQNVGGCTSTDRGTRWTDIAMGMFSSSQLFLLEVETPQLTVLRISEGLRSFFRHLPLDNTIIGECLSHYVDLSSAQLLRSVVQEYNERGTEKTFDITLRTFPHPGLVLERVFFVQRIALQSSVTELWLLSPYPSRPSSPCHFSNWKIEKVQDLSGVYEFNAINSSYPPWHLEEVMDSLEPPDARTGWFNGMMDKMTLTDSSKMTIESLGRTEERTGAPQGGSSFSLSTWTRHVKNMTLSMSQQHFTFDLTSDMVPTVTCHVRLKLPKITGGLRTPWLKLARFKLNGTPGEVSGGMRTLKHIRCFVMQSPPSSDGGGGGHALGRGGSQMRLLIMHFRPSSVSSVTPHGTESTTLVSSMQCCHTRELDVSSQGISSTGERP